MKGEPIFLMLSRSCLLTSGYLQLRDYFRFDAIARPNRLVPEDGFLPFQALEQQRMQNFSFGSFGEGKLGNLSIHHKHAARNVSA